MTRSKKSLQSIKQEFKEADRSGLTELFREYGEDERAGVISLICAYRRKLEQYDIEKRRLTQMCCYERMYRSAGLICGIDEVGRGPLAGPVYAGAVILPEDCFIPFINDSKKLSPSRREALSDEIMEKAVSVGIGAVSPQRIDEINILQATYEAMRQAVSKLTAVPSALLVDAVSIPNINIMQVPIIKGDMKSISIAAASIVAKVARDHLMMEYDKEYPGYHFASNKGYGSAEHIEAIRRLGPSPIHRRTFISHFTGAVVENNE